MVSVAALLSILIVAVLPSVAQLPRRPYGVRETLEVAGEAVEAVLARERPPHCSVILLTDGTTSATTVFTELGKQQRTPRGMAVFEVPTDGKMPNLMQTQLSRVLDEARRLRQVSGCVTLVVVSDDPAFLATSAEWSLKGRLLTWSNKLLAVTRRPLQDLRHLYTSFSMMNAMLITVDAARASPRCSMHVHLPYSSTVLKVASWRPPRGLSFTSNLPLFPDKFYRFLLRPTLKITAEEFPPHVVVTEAEGRAKSGQRFAFSGAMTQILEVLAHSHNFSYTILRPPDGSFGTKLANGTATGMVGMVGRKEVDLGLGPFGITAVRAEIVDYTSPVVSDSLRIMGGRGKPEIDPWGFLLPLTPLVWTAVLAALVLVLATVLLLASCFAVETPMLSIYVRVLLQENTWVPSERWWERLVLGGWMLVMLIMTQSYSGNLMSLLAVRYIPQPHQTLRDLLDDASTTMVWEFNTAYVNHFRTSESGIYSEVRESENLGRIEYVLATEYPRMQDELVRLGRYVFVGEDLTIKVLMAQDFSSRGQCDFYTSREAFMPFLYCMIGHKNSPLIPSISRRYLRGLWSYVLNNQITSMTEAGLYDYWMKSLNMNSTVCVHPPTKITVKSSLSFTNVWGMFVVFAGGNTAGLLMLCLELLISPYHQRQRSSPRATLHC